MKQGTFSVLRGVLVALALVMLPIAPARAQESGGSTATLPLEDALHAARRSGDRIVDNPGWTAATLVRLARVDEARGEFQRLIGAVTPVWAGDGPPSAEAVFNWFVNAYPLRLDADRKMLRDAVETAMHGA